MVNYREIIRLKSQNYSNSHVAISVRSSRNTVSEVWALAQDKGIAWPFPVALKDEDIQQLLFPNKIQTNGRKMPDYEYIHHEMAKSGVTLTLLWSEYSICCNNEHLIPYQYTQFCDNYHSFIAKTKATLRIKRKPGELMEVDWAGNTLSIYDEITGEEITAYVFVASLSCSLYGYAEAFPNMKSESWIKAHIHAYQFFGGVTRILVPDNLKTGVIKNTRLELILNKTYQEMAEHYGTAIIPARPLAPKDKPTAEGTVGVISTWIIAALRNRKFFSFEELNLAMHEKLKEFNEKPFQKKKGSRLSAFEEEEQSFLMPLPASIYETAVWSTATIQPDYLITVGNCKYSVPYEFIGKSVDIRSTNNCIEVFYHNNRIASHTRKNSSMEPIYLPEHMPEKHQRYLTWNSETFLEWAANVGSSTLLVVRTFLTFHKVEQQGYKACGSLMKLADKYSLERIENACSRALSYTPSPSLKNIQTILKNGQDMVKDETKGDIPVRTGQYGFTRGASYFEGGANQ